MAAMTYTNMPTTEPRAGRYAYPLVSGFDGFPGSLVGLLGGELVKWADTSGITFLGFLLDFEGNATGLVESATGTAFGRVNENGDIITGVPVAGTTPAIDDLVYCASDNWATDLTKVATSNAGPIGVIVGGDATNGWNVKTFTPTEAKGL
jgi:hypothetical protein